VQDNCFIMTINESEIWDRFNNKSIPIDPKWLETIYSLNLSHELRYLICERLGLLADIGWQPIKKLLKSNGNQPELIYAAGLCHQKEARDFLLECLNTEKEVQVDILKALECWGAFLSFKDLKKIFSEKSFEIRLAGLNLLSFKSHLLNEDELLDLVADLLEDFREEVVINTIRVLQRRNEYKIIDRISRMVDNGSNKIVEAALIALGAIGTDLSAQKLLRLSQQLDNPHHRYVAQKQLKHQYLTLN